MHSTHLGIVFAGTVNCKSDNANPAAPGQTGANPGQIKSTDYPDESSSRIDLELASMENWLNQPANYVPWYSSGGSSFYSGTWLQLVANAPVGGSAGFYDIVQTDTPAIKYSTYQFNHDYNTMNVNANHVGRHMLCFVVNNHPSNVVVVDVFAQVPTTQYQTGTPTTMTPPTSTPPQTTSFGGDTPVTIQSQGMRGYQVFLDGNYIGTEGTGGDPLDGKFSFSVVGNQNHDIRAYDGQSTTRRRCTSKEEFRR